MGDRTNRARVPHAVVSIQWRTIAVGSLLLNAGAVAVVATFSIRDDADALSTVALALAVIAFICQLIIFSVQTWQAGEQLRQARDLNASTLQLITQASERIEATHRMVSTQHDELLHMTALELRVEQNKAGSDPPSALVSEPAAVAGVLTGSLPTYDRDDQAPESLTGGTGARLLSVAGYLKWPSVEDLRPALELLESFGPRLIRNFSFDIGNDILTAMSGREPGIGMAESEGPLIAAGLLAETTPRLNTSPDLPERRVILTSEGRRVGALLTAPWPPPPELAGLADRLWELRAPGREAAVGLDGDVASLATALGERDGA